jgi:hypothetical protein
MPLQMEAIVDKYNTDAHDSLSHLMGFNVSPLQVLEDPELEAFIARKNMAFNFNRKGVRELANGTQVDAFLHTSFGSNKYDVIRGASVVEKDVNNYVIEKNGRRYLVPRFLLVPI